ncbi:hypothetical protein [Flagellimonas flava]|uniref:OmpA family protein n=1 Tax=Flagellimonas flava TaxID=570519 RepID=A0A1M5IGR7_9FLAO|nr:hypothetical protein [Allomuricauda flava]SHG27471.1 hypothetical protein SAMN04488116_0696 [Allomuricauda flava]
MKKRLLLCSCLLITISGFAQKKSELFAQIDELKTQISETEQELAKAKREISSSNAKAEALETENVSLRDANATLLKNLSNFSELSKKNSENVTKTLAALERKEKQLSGISDQIASSDSTSIVVLTRIKQTMGENSNANVADGAVVLSSSLNKLFGSDTGLELTDEGKLWLSQVAKVLLASPNRTAQVEGLNITGEFGVTYDQANVVTKELVNNLQVPNDRIGTSVKDGNFKEGISISLQPDYKGFYDKAKSDLKATN